MDKTLQCYCALLLHKVLLYHDLCCVFSIQNGSTIHFSHLSLSVEDRLKKSRIYDGYDVHRSGRLGAAVQLAACGRPVAGQC